MRHGKNVMLAGALAVALQAGACDRKTSALATPAKVAAAKVERIEGTDRKSVTLTAKASERAGVRTAPVADAPANKVASKTGGKAPWVVPYGAVLYDARGQTWVYTSPKALTFVRQPIQVSHIDGDLAHLAEGPPTGTEVVVVGASVLYGAETGIGK